MNISPNHFDSIIKNGYSLDHVYLLELIRDEINIDDLIKYSVKIATLYQTLIRKELIVNNILTIEGKNLLEFIENDDAIKYTKIKISNDNFNKWWNIYPGTDTFTINNKTFNGSRGLRVNKQGCLKEFNKIISIGVYTPEQLIKALEYDVNQKKKESLKSNSNKLTFMQNSLTYLNQESFEPFIELINNKTDDSTSNYKSFDI